jgi:hypothetical protein
MHFSMGNSNVHFTHENKFHIQPKSRFICHMYEGEWPEFLATDAEVPGSIPSATRFSEKQWVWNGVHSAS